MKIKITTLAGILAFLPVIAFSEDAGQPPANNEARFESTANRLNLSAEQKEKISALRQSQKQQMQALLEELKSKRQQVQAKLNDPATTRERIAPLVAEVKDLHAKIIDLRINNIFAIKEKLSADQVGKLQQFRQQRGGGEKGRGRFWLEKWRANREKMEKTKQEE